MKTKDKTKFEFSIEFQLEILRFLVRSKEAGLVINRIKPSYLVLIEHALIAEGIFKYYKKNKKYPQRIFLKR